MKRLFSLLALLLVFMTGCGEMTTDQITEQVTDQVTEKVKEEGNKQADELADKVNGAAESAANEAKKFLSDLTDGAETSSPTSDSFYEVERVVDGDTIVVLQDGQEVKVRLLMVDTPEVHGVDTPEPYGPEASAFTKDLLTGEAVQLEYDQEKYDPYDRTLAYAYLEDGRMVNELLLKEGLASMVIYEPNDKYESEFREIEAQAKANNNGMWSE